MATADKIRSAEMQSRSEMHPLETQTRLTFRKAVLLATFLECSSIIQSTRSEH